SRRMALSAWPNGRTEATQRAVNQSTRGTADIVREAIYGRRASRRSAPLRSRLTCAVVPTRLARNRGDQLPRKLGWQIGEYTISASKLRRNAQLRQRRENASSRTAR